MMQNSDSEGWNFLSAPNTHVFFFFFFFFFCCFVFIPFNLGCFILEVALITTHNDVDVGHF